MRVQPKRRSCPGSGIYTGLMPGHYDECVDCGRKIRTTTGHRLADHTVPVNVQGDPIPLSAPKPESGER